MKEIFSTARLHVLLQPVFLMCGFFWNSFLTKTISVDSYGLFTLSLTIFSILSITANLGSAGGVMRFIPLYQESNSQHLLKNVYRLSIFIPLTLSLLLYGILYVGKRTIDENFVFGFSEVFPILGLYIIINSVGSSLMKISITNGDFLRTKLNELFFQKVLPILLLCIVSILHIPGLKVVITVFIVCNLASLFYWVILIRKYYQSIPTKDKGLKLDKEFLRFSILSGISSILSMIYLWSDNILIGFYMENYDVGLYGAMFIVAVIVRNFWFMAFTPILLPVLTKYIVRKEHSEVIQTFETLQKILVALTLPVATVFLVGGDYLISLMYTDEYLNGLSAFQTLVLLYTVCICFGYSSYVVSAEGRADVIFKLTVFTLVINIVLNMILIPKYGLIGAAIATGMSEVVFSLSCFAFIRRKYKIKLWDWSVAISILSLIILYVTPRTEVDTTLICVFVIALTIISLCFKVKNSIIWRDRKGDL
ncbi:polysaccharide biosynthesis C-terminal domain-containing protein [Vibrio brasiliensis]|uniref:Heteropolysaccharide repeat-containing protein n=1 Tax=Vibrio brasiliensis LMG 20546 TaxID=945543 RepID=E8M049_9VIBR|nr:polysaccharide biosynthesis C-terminal domain-containing protein [Vibrio brasiliensis]EGA63701.1 heteropolysaccharide repeat-containing protein [Vibrio brasiliensis LMG 20546]